MRPFYNIFFEQSQEVAIFFIGTRVIRTLGHRLLFSAFKMLYN